MIDCNTFQILGLLFVNKKKQKNFIYAPPEALATPKPMSPHHKSFLLLFFKKEVLGFI
jgi:hypothetical protein